MGVNYQRALVLFQQTRYDLAEKELQQELNAEPESPGAHTLLALCLTYREAYAEATDAAQKAIALDPDSPFAHYTLAKVMLDRNRYAEAKTSIDEAIRLDPENSAFYGLRAMVRFEQRDWAGALESADTGLQLDPEDTQCNNLRAMALVKLGRRDEAGQTIESTLARAPENAATHANQGWALLEARDYTKAMEHFKEALRLNPQSEWARQGIVEALKAKHFIYSLMLSYFLWMAKFSQSAQIGIVIGGYLGFQYLQQVADDHPAYAPFIWVVLGAYILFGLLTWLARPLFNLALRLSKFGRLVLSREETIASNFVGAGLLLALGWVMTWALTKQSDDMYGALFFGVLVIPLAGTFNTQKGWPRWVMAAYTFGLYGLFSYIMYLWKSQPNSYAASVQVKTLMPVFTWGLILSSWVANALTMVTVRK